MEKYIEELKLCIPKALYDQQLDVYRRNGGNSAWQSCLEAVKIMAGVWEDVLGKDLVWVPGHFEDKLQKCATGSGRPDEVSTTQAPPFPYPYYHLAYYDEHDSCFDEEFGDADCLPGYLQAMFVRNIVDADSPPLEKIRLFYYCNEGETYEISLRPKGRPTSKMYSSAIVAAVTFAGARLEPRGYILDDIIQKATLRLPARTDVVVHFGFNAACDLIVSGMAGEM